MKLIRKRKSPVTLIYILVVMAVTFTVLWLVRPLITDSATVVTSISSTNTLRNATDLAIERLREQVELQPESSYGFSQLGDTYLQKARETGDSSYLSRAEEALLNALELDPQNHLAMTSMGALSLTRHEFQQAAEWAHRSIEVSSINPDAYGVLGDAQVELGLYDEAVESIQTMIDIKPSLASYARVSHIRKLMGDTEGAIEAMQLAIDAGAPGTEVAAWARVQLGNLHLGMGDYDEAIINYEGALREFDDYYIAQAALGKAFAAQGRLDDAIEQYEKVVKMIPQPEILASLGDLYAKVGNAKQAQIQYDTIELIAELETANGIQFNRELALFYADHDIKLDKALELAKAEIEVRKDIYGYDALAWALYKNDMHEEALESIEEALKLGTQDAELFYHAGLIYSEVGDSETAANYLKQAIELNPSFSPIFAEHARQALNELEQLAKLGY